MPHEKIPCSWTLPCGPYIFKSARFYWCMRREVAQLDPDLPVSEVATMEEVIAESIWQPRLYAMLFAVFAGGALLLALIGIYGVWHSSCRPAPTDRHPYGPRRQRARRF